MERVVLKGNDAGLEMFFPRRFCQRIHSLLPRFIRSDPLCVLTDLGHLIDHLRVRKVGVQGRVTEAHDLLDLSHGSALAHQFLNLIRFRIGQDFPGNQQLLNLIGRKGQLQGSSFNPFS